MQLTYKNLMDQPQHPPVDPNWWRTLFDEVYLKTDARSVQDADLTRREVDGLLAALGLSSEEAILDLCGGHGRHALELARRGYLKVLVLDFSQPLLTRGRAQAREEGLAVNFLRADARRVPLSPEAFNTVLCLANSFGYGATRRDDLQILTECHRLLKPGGRVYLEVSDPGYVRRHLAPQTWHEAEGLVVCRQRWVTEEFLVCREVVLARARGLVRDQTYRLRLYDPEALRVILTAAGFSQVAVIPQGHPYARPGDRGALTRRLAATAWK